MSDPGQVAFVCTACNTQNDADCAFCGECGEPLPQTKLSNCSNCQFANEASARFCGECGDPMQSDLTRASVRINAQQVANCNMCGGINSPHANFCAFCGAQMVALVHAQSNDGAAVKSPRRGTFSKMITKLKSPRGTTSSTSSTEDDERRRAADEEKRRVKEEMRLLKEQEKLLKKKEKAALKKAELKARADALEAKEAAKEKKKAAEAEQRRLAALPDCAKCTRRIDGDAQRIGDLHFHDEHFVCVRCNSRLDGGAVLDDDALCARCVSAAQTCAKCARKISPQRDVLTVGGHKYHAKCLTCVDCKCSLDGQMASVGEHRYVCVSCLQSRTRKQASSAGGGTGARAHCTKCGKTLSSTQTFCNACGNPVTGGADGNKARKFLQKLSPRGRSVDEETNVARPNRTTTTTTTRTTTTTTKVPSCDVCRRPITDDHLTIGAKHLHRLCAKCAKCRAALSEGTIMAKGSNLYCGNCASDAVESCSGCGGVLTGTFIVVGGEKYHEKCLKCAYCSTRLKANSGMYEVRGRMACKKCAQKG